MYLSYLEGAILGLVQGLAEFLPISSSGHLAALQYFFGVDAERVLFFSIMLHVGTLVSLLAVYYKDIGALIWEFICTIKDICTGKGPRINSSEHRRLMFLIIVATIPTGIIGLLFSDTFDKMYQSLLPIGIFLLVTGALLWLAERVKTGRKTEKNAKWRNAIMVGIFQGLAICPGLSRSGTTMTGGLLAGLSRPFAVRFAFLISLPSILGAAILEVPDAIEAGVDPSIVGPMVVGMIIAAVSGFFAIKTMIRVVSNKKLHYFSYYVWIVGAFLIIWHLTH